MYVLGSIPARHAFPIRRCAAKHGAHLSKRPSKSCQSTLPFSSLLRSMSGRQSPQRVAIALGSNLGDRVANIESAIRLMGNHGINIRQTSHLYETAPMYYESQGAFLNCACEAETCHEPLQLLDNLQSIENALGRKRTFEKGPRTVDLDVLTYADQVIQNSRLTVPHPRLSEREFVLRPMNDIIPDTAIPSSNTKVSNIYSQLESRDLSMSPVTQLSPHSPLIRSTDPSRKTRIMAIVNLTPDSFSDGGSHDSSNLPALQRTLTDLVSHGTSIIDIGGQSTRPGATQITADEELSRILPAIRLIRESSELSSTVISVDTFLPSVARQVIEAGADIINDISGGQLSNDEILRVVAETGKTIVLMHMRGDPSTMNSKAEYPTGVVQEVAHELKDRINVALAAGIPPWRIILDPGIGFAKTQQHNLSLLYNLAELRSTPCLAGYSWLLGTSRKKFIGTITGVKEPRERLMGTAATVTASIAGGADIVRVHDGAQMSQVVAMSDAIYRT